jgi:hypothetical protein
VHQRQYHHLHYQKSYEELQDELSDMVQQYSKYGRIGRNGYEFNKAWNHYIYTNRFDFDADQECGLHRLMSDDCLISNIYDGSSFEIQDRNGKSFKINRGCKVSKVLGKLANILNLPGWEDFRICHSQILNQKDLGGNLTISIHPLDYMTMSDNSYGWESCMSWESEGGYRQGTVEMMNSRSVVIAYLSGEDKMRIGDDFWNSKKWRMWLFLEDHRHASDQTFGRILFLCFDRCLGQIDRRDRETFGIDADQWLIRFLCPGQRIDIDGCCHDPAQLVVGMIADQFASSRCGEKTVFPFSI